VRLANAEGPFGNELAPPRAIPREVGKFCEGGRGVVCARFAIVLEVAPAIQGSGINGNINVLGERLLGMRATWLAQSKVRLERERSG
jgi:hypothetical protein